MPRRRQHAQGTPRAKAGARRPRTRNPRPGPRGNLADWQGLARQALCRRRRLLEDPRTNALRLLNGAADGLDGLVVEQLGDVLVAQLHEGRLAVDEAVARDVCAWLAEQVAAHAVYRKRFPRDRSTRRDELERAHCDATPWFGQPVEPEVEVRENEMCLLARPYDGYATGLFLEHRDNRRRVRTLARGRRVLNTFAYTCNHTVAAALGGATETVSVDLSRKALEWGRRNLARNGCQDGPHRFIADDARDVLRRAARRGETFGLVILDPPTFARGRRGRRTFNVSADLRPLVEHGLSLLAPGGYLLLSVNMRSLTQQHLEQALSTAARHAGAQFVLRKRPELPIDFRGDPSYAKSVMVTRR